VLGDREAGDAHEPRPANGPRRRHVVAAVGVLGVAMGVPEPRLGVHREGASADVHAAAAQADVEVAEGRLAQAGRGGIENAVHRLSLDAGVVVAAERQEHPRVGVAAVDGLGVGGVVRVAAVDGRPDEVVLEHHDGLAGRIGGSAGHEGQSLIGVAADAVGAVRRRDGDDLVAAQVAQAGLVAEQREEPLRVAVVVPRHDEDGQVEGHEGLADGGEILLGTAGAALIHEIAHQDDRVGARLADGAAHRALDGLAAEPRLAGRHGACVVGALDVMQVGEHEQIEGRGILGASHGAACPSRAVVRRRAKGLPSYTMRADV